MGYGLGSLKGGGGNGDLSFEDFNSGEQVSIVPPENVSNISVVSKNTNSISITFSLSVGAIEYKIYDNMNNLIGTTDSNSYTIEGLEDSTSYTFKITSIGSFDNESEGINFTETTDEPDITPPNDVTNITSSNIKSTSLQLDWNASSSADTVSYEIWKTSPSSGKLAVVEETSYIVKDLVKSTSYSFLIKAVDSSGNISDGTPITVSTIEPVNIVTDNFNRTNQTGLGTATTGQTWVSVSNMSIDANKAKPTLSTDAKGFIDHGLTDEFEINVTLSIPSSSLNPYYVWLKYLDFNNTLYIIRESAAIKLYKRVNGVNTQVGFTYTAPNSYPLDMDVKIVATGNTVIVYINGVQAIRDTIAELKTTFLNCSKSGIGAYFATKQVLFDNFIINQL